MDAQKISLTDFYNFLGAQVCEGTNKNKSLLTDPIIIVT